MATSKTDHLPISNYNQYIIATRETIERKPTEKNTQSKLLSNELKRN